MDAPESPQGHRISELAAQRLQCYQGCAIIHLQHLRFETNPILGDRQLDDRNIERPRKVFEIEGCGNLEPEYRVAALIDQGSLSKGISQSDLTRESLLDQTIQPRLLFKHGVRLTTDRACMAMHRVGMGWSDPAEGNCRPPLALLGSQSA